jgi:ATPase subunit of ABC transporter with duplicated ATPase domains
MNPSEMRKFQQDYFFDRLVDTLREALENASREKAREVWNEIKDDKHKQEKLKKKLTEEENLNVRLLLNTGFVKGTRLKYVGTCEQYLEEELLLANINISTYGEVTLACLRPNGKGYTTWLKPNDLRKKL